MVLPQTKFDCSQQEMSEGHIRAINGFRWSDMKAPETAAPVLVTGTPNPPATTTTVVANAGANRNVASGAQTILGGTDSISNPSGSTTILWERRSGTGGSLSSTSAAAPTFTAPTLARGASNRAITFRKTVTNNEVTDFKDVVITVLAPDAPPRARPGNHNRHGLYRALGNFHAVHAHGRNHIRKSPAHRLDAGLELRKPDNLSKRLPLPKNADFQRWRISIGDGVDRSH